MLLLTEKGILGWGCFCHVKDAADLQLLALQRSSCCKHARGALDSKGSSFPSRIPCPEIPALPHARLGEPKLTHPSPLPLKPKPSPVSQLPLPWISPFSAWYSILQFLIFYRISTRCFYDFFLQILQNSTDFSRSPQRGLWVTPAPGSPAFTDEKNSCLWGQGNPAPFASAFQKGPAQHPENTSFIP